MGRRIGFVVVLLALVGGLGQPGVGPTSAQEESCEARYGQAGDLMQQAQTALDAGNVISALALSSSVHDLLGGCPDTAEDYVFFRADDDNRTWNWVTETINGVEMVQVPAGCFMMGSDDGEADEQPVHERCFYTPYWIDKTEVTRAMYAECVAAGVCTETPDSDVSTRDTQPINRVTWFQARDYCQWRGGQLPTESEWEYAARGPNSRTYPWGDEFDPFMPIYANNFEDELPDVGSKPFAGSWVGALDMSGSVWEWIDTLYQPYPADEMLETGLADESDTQPRVRRGGSFYDGLATALRGAKRGSNPPSFELDAGGFRCVSEPPVTLQPDQCDEGNYQQAGQLVQVGSEALASGHVSYALFLLETIDDALASCIGNTGWQPVVETVSGADMVQVPAGCFMMGSDDGEADEQPVHEVCFDATYWIDKTEVTRAMYAECVAAGVCTETPDNTYSTRDTQPINNVTWFQARNYCAWRGARLPSEAEWEYAARGPDDWVYPWGDEFALRNVVYQQELEAADVGSLPAGASWVGALDMSGNVWEWVSSAYKSYPYVPDEGREDLTDVDSARVWRGGSFYDYQEEDLRAAARGQFTPNYAVYTNGFRCARDE